MSHTPGTLHHSPENSRHGQQLVYASDGNLLANVGSFRRSDTEDLANTHRVIECWNACEKIKDPKKIKEGIERLEQLCNDIDEDRGADPGAQSACLRIRQTLRLLKG